MFASMDHNATRFVCFFFHYNYYMIIKLFSNFKRLATATVFLLEKYVDNALLSDMNMLENEFLVTSN